ncbi:DUF397 domain-containing protein [Streptomyces sp. NPDC059009]|uniref:DUF397 domain-containing protein n=1 Tax=Streptomyces sp. NPDC059009 TaxID=3346694 RepID=UPI0036C63522
MSDLYTLPVNEGSAENFCGGNQGGEHEQCVEITDLVGGGYVLRDTKPEGAGKELRFTEAEMDKFVRGYAEKHGISL